MDQERLKLRAAGRKHAQLVIDMTLEDSDKTPEFIAAFLDELRAILSPPTIEEIIVHKRTLLEMSNWTISFGKHAGHALPDIPRDYLHWLVKSAEDTKNVVSEYLEVTKNLDDDTD